MQRSAVSECQFSARSLPVLVSVPHAGRDLPVDIAAEARVSRCELERLSDGWSDLIAAPLLAAGARVIKANMLRAVADCNRHEGDMDVIDVTVPLRPRFGPPGRKARAGLGVVPTRLLGSGQLWRRPLSPQAFEARLNQAYRPFHTALAAARAALLARFGHVLVIDLHSMPSLPLSTMGRAAQIVVGDRHGRSADPAIAAKLMQRATEQGFRAAHNNPYPGGHIVTAMGAPLSRVHAVQVEFDRALYLNADGRADADRALALGEWLRDAVLALLPRLSASDDWLLAAE